MTRHVMCFVLLGGALAGWAFYSGGWSGPTTDALAAQATTAQANDGTRQVILKNVRTYMDAYNRRDIKTLVSLFTEDCFFKQKTAYEIHGRKELEEELKETFADEPTAQISVEVDSLTFVTPDV